MLKTKNLRVLSLLALILATKSKLDWQCGVANTEWFTLIVVQTFCGYNALREISSCCIQHDICYDDHKMSQYSCDKAFCKCLGAVTLYMKYNIKTLYCVPLMQISCSAVGIFGGLARTTPKPTPLLPVNAVISPKFSASRTKP